MKFLKNFPNTYINIGDIDVQQTIQIIREIFGKEEKPITPVPPRIELSQGPPTELLTIFQSDLNHQFSFAITSLFPVEPLISLREIQVEMILGIIGNVYHF